MQNVSVLHANKSRLVCVGHTLSKVNIKSKTIASSSSFNKTSNIISAFSFSSPAFFFSLDLHSAERRGKYGSSS